MENKDYSPEMILDIEDFIKESNFLNINFSKWYYFYHLLNKGIKANYSASVLFRLRESLLNALVLCSTNNDCDLYEKALIILESNQIRTNIYNIVYKK